MPRTYTHFLHTVYSPTPLFLLFYCYILLFGPLCFTNGALDSIPYVAIPPTFGPLRSRGYAATDFIPLLGTPEKVITLSLRLTHGAQEAFPYQASRCAGWCFQVYAPLGVFSGKWSTLFARRRWRNLCSQVLLQVLGVPPMPAPYGSHEVFPSTVKFAGGECVVAFVWLAVRRPFPTGAALPLSRALFRRPPPSTVGAPVVHSAHHPQSTPGPRVCPYQPGAGCSSRASVAGRLPFTAPLPSVL